MSAVAAGTTPRRSTGLRVVRTLCVRLAVALGTLLLISVITFAATNAMPWDPARIALGKLATPGSSRVRPSEGLDRPVVTRYCVGRARGPGGWGQSVLANRASVRSEVVPRMIRRASSAGSCSSSRSCCAFALGVYSGSVAAGPPIRRLAVTLIFNATPEFVTALLVVVLFAVELDWLPIESASGIVRVGHRDTIKAYIAPVLTLVGAHALHDADGAHQRA